MAKRSAKNRRRNTKRGQSTIASVMKIGAFVLVLIAAGVVYFHVASANPDLNPETMCPRDSSKLTGITVLLADVTDPLNLPQKQDFLNQLDQLVSRIPRHGKLIVTKVDPVGEQLLRPVIERCNPGNGSDTNEISGNPKKLEMLHREKFVEPLRTAFETLFDSSGAQRSPILESVQSVNLTDFSSSSSDGLPKKLVIVSDLLQHTNAMSFYKKIPKAEDLVEGAAFRRVRTDLRGVEVELWMLERADAKATQPRTLADLWAALIQEQKGRILRIYNISG